MFTKTQESSHELQLLLKVAKCQIKLMCFSCVSRKKKAKKLLHKNCLNSNLVLKCVESKKYFIQIFQKTRLLQIVEPACVSIFNFGIFNELRKCWKASGSVPMPVQRRKKPKKKKKKSEREWQCFFAVLHKLLFQRTHLSPNE